VHANAPLPGPTPEPWPQTVDRRRQRTLAQISVVALVANIGGILASSVYCIAIGKWWGIFVVWLAFGVGPIKIGWWSTLPVAVVVWLIGFPLVAVLVAITLPIELLLVSQERRLKRESIALGDASKGAHRPELATTGNLSRSKVEESIRSVFGEGNAIATPGLQGELRVLWRDPSYSVVPPVIAVNELGTCCGDESGLRFLESHSGDELWRIKSTAKLRPHVVVPVGSDLLVYYRMERIEDDVVARVDGGTGAVLWQRRQSRSPDPIACGDETVVVDDRFLMLVAVDGRTVWSTAPFHLGPREVASDGTRIAVLDLSNRVSLLNGEGEMLWRMRLDDDMRDASLDSSRQRITSKIGGRAVMLASLAISDHEVIVTAERGAVCLDATTGSVRWAARQPGGWTRPCVAENRVLMTLPTEIVALDLETGQLAWRHEFADHPVTGASSYGDRALLAGRRELHLIALSDGGMDSVALGSEASPNTADDAERVSKVMRFLAPVAAGNGEIIVWIAGTGLAAVTA
jgi:PQQ-like domain